MPKFALGKLTVDELAIKKVAVKTAVEEDTVFKCAASYSNIFAKSAISKLHAHERLTVTVVMERGANYYYAS